MTALLVLRFAEYGAAALLFGMPLLLLSSGPAQTPPAATRMIRLSALVLLLAAPLHFLAQTAQVAGVSWTALDLATLKAAFLELNFGKAILVRGLAALIALGMGKNRGVAAALGAVASASFAWMGHGAASEGAAGWLHLGNDILHILAASAWIGALAVFAVSLKSATPQTLPAALADFSAAGIVFVAVLLATGIVNSLFMVGTIPSLWQSLYGLVLLAKIVLFLMMLALAARNRLLLRTDRTPMTAIRSNLLLETGLGFAVLALVAWLGMLPPPG